MEVRGYYSRLPVSLSFEGVESMTQMAHLDQTDVNEIVRKYHRTGYLPPAKFPPQYVDCVPLRGESLQERIAFVEDMMSEIPEFEAEYRRRVAAAEAAAKPVVDSEVVSS